VHVRGGIVTRPAEPSTFAAALAEMPELIAALLRDHAPNHRGLCRACGLPGTGTPHLTTPCSLRRIAEAARTIRIQRLR
jgi:hypothetical protein